MGGVTARYMCAWVGVGMHAQHLPLLIGSVTVRLHKPAVGDVGLPNTCCDKHGVIPSSLQAAAANLMCTV
jgi:hypothetical protein